MEFILTWAAADAVNQWLHRNDMSDHPMELGESLQLYFKLGKAMEECVEQHNIQFQGDSMPVYAIATHSCEKVIKWIDAQGKEVNRYCHFINRVCDIRNTIRDGVKELHETNGFSIEGELIYKEQTNYWLKRAQNMGRLCQKPTSCHERS
jgi:hypothetical protein